jgi:hypothetical protein
MRMITTFADGSKLYYDKGNFDEWCVYYEQQKKKRHALKDVEYFRIAQLLATEFGAKKVYADFLHIYDKTDSTLNPAIIAVIQTMALQYKPQESRAEKLFVVLYATMIAEENLEGRPLKKKIKKLGFYQAIFGGFTAIQAANFSRNKSAVKQLLPLIDNIEVQGF